MGRIAVIDIGTVTARLSVVEGAPGAPMEQLAKRSTICNMGEGTAETGRLAPGAIRRVLDCVGGYVEEARARGAEAIACTLTSAARDAANAVVLLDPLGALGLEPQVIPGTTEGSLALLGVAQDFPETEVLVADSGGGSTEFTKGGIFGGALRVDYVRSLDVGCRRLTDLFLSREDPPAAGDIEEARAFCDAPFEEAARELAQAGIPAERLVLVGGTATSLVAMDAALDPYDPAFVHLHALSRDAVERQLERLASMRTEARADIVGLQAKRAPVILGGAVAVAEILATTGFVEATVSEHDLLCGLSLAALAAWTEMPDPLPWRPAMRPLA